MKREPCCDQDFGGSHYHCGHCGEVSSMQGHYVATPEFTGFICAEPKHHLATVNGHLVWVAP